MKIDGDLLSSDEAWIELRHRYQGFMEMLLDIFFLRSKDLITAVCNARKPFKIIENWCFCSFYNWILDMLLYVDVSHSHDYQRLFGILLRWSDLLTLRWHPAFEKKIGSISDLKEFVENFHNELLGSLKILFDYGEIRCLFCDSLYLISIHCLVRHPPTWASSGWVVNCLQKYPLVLC